MAMLCIDVELPAPILLGPPCRTLFLDIVAGLLYKIQRRRKDLRLIVSSATLDAEMFRSFFNHNQTGLPDHDTAAIMTIEVEAFSFRDNPQLSPF